MSDAAAIVFAGPSLAGSALRPAAGIEIRPPAMLGDLARAARERPAAIGLIDGRFETVPAPWHKEILWVMEAGIAVYGAASMGALRAAELDRFGMQGVGAVYEAYRDGALEDDDEVAVLHGPPEAGSVPLGVAMVDVRATVEAAAREGVLAPASATALTSATKALFYKDRTWAAVLAAAGEVMSRMAKEALERWLPSGRVERKRLDAEALLTAVAARGVACRRVEVAAVERPRSVEAIVRRASGAPVAVDGALLDDLRLEPDAYRTRSREALMAVLAADALARTDGAADPDDQLQRFREVLGLYRAADLEAWLGRRRIDRDRLRAALALGTAAERLMPLLRAEIDAAVLDLMPLDADYPARLGRATRAADCAEGAAQIGDEGANPAALLGWWCRRIGRELPDSPATLARELGFVDVAAFHAALAAAHRAQGGPDG